MNALKKVVQERLKSSFDISVTRHSRSLADMAKLQRAADDVALLQMLPNEHAAQIVEFLSRSKSQLRQDLFVLSELNFKRNGFFVEFGATNGVDLSNTHLLEKSFGWAGLLAEPAKCWHTALRANRTAAIEERCVWTESDLTLSFNEVAIAELSTIDSYSDKDLHKQSRQRGTTYEVRTVSFNDLLAKHDAPAEMDYLSIDTEGSEYDILRNFDFGKRSFRVITCEHNYTPARERIADLLKTNGYTRKYEGLSKFDDWYVKNT